MVENGILSPNAGEGIFVVDFDGTLLRDDKTVAGEDRRALVTLRQHGVITVVATGRSLYSFRKIMNELERDSGACLPLDYVILSTGAAIMEFSTGSFLQSRSLSGEDAVAISRVLDGLGLNYMVHRRIPETHYFLSRLNSSSSGTDFDIRLDMYREFSEMLTSRRLLRFGGVTEILVIVREEQGKEVTSILAEKLQNNSVIRATSPLDHRSAWIEIFAQNVSKSKAVAWLAGKLAVPRRRVCGVGNDYNDLDLLDWAGLACLVANGPEHLHSRYCVVAENNCCGVREAANRFLEALGYSDFSSAGFGNREKYHKTITDPGD
ncbi:HAD family hydrolase [Desulfomarina sp.]